MKLKRKTITNLGTSGLNTDVSPWELPPEFITAGNNFRTYAGAIKSAGGYEDWSSSGAASFYPGFIMYMGSSFAKGEWLIPGRDAVYRFNGEQWVNISSDAGYALGTDNELFWNGCMLGQIPIINNTQVHPEYWLPGGGSAKMLPLQFDPDNTWDDVNKSFKVIRSHKNFLFALNLTEAGDAIPSQPSGYRWSHPADINGLPYTWSSDGTDLSSLAGKASIGADNGEIIDGMSMRDSFCIYSDNGINVLDPSYDEFVWRRRELSSTVGLLASNCVIEVKGRHFFLGDGDVLMNDGNSVQSIVHNRIRQRMTSSISADYYSRSYAVRNTALKEIWFCVPEDGAQYPNIAYIYNWRDDSWSIRDLPYAEVNEVPTIKQTYATYGPKLSPEETWEDDITNYPNAPGDDPDAFRPTWDSDDGTWSSRSKTPLEDTVVGVFSDEDEVKVLDPQVSYDAGNLDSFMERTNFPLEGLEQVATISRVYPHIKGTQPVTIQFGSQEVAGGSVRWEPASSFTPSVDRKIDLRSTGSLHCWRISSKGVGNWSISGFDIEYTTNGVR